MKNYISVAGVILLAVFIRFGLYYWVYVKTINQFPEATNIVSSLSAWNRWDAVHYLNIAQYGYMPAHLDRGTIFFMSRFPPVYPFFIWMAVKIFGLSYLTAGLGVSLTCMILSSVILYIMVSKSSDSRASGFWSVLFFNLFPTSYFGNAPYAEALFIFLILMYFAVNRLLRSYFLGALVFILVLFTRVFGIFLYPLHIYYLYRRYKTGNIRASDVVGLLLPGALLSIYIINQSLSGMPGYLGSSDPSSIKVGLPFAELFSTTKQLVQDISSLNQPQVFMGLGGIAATTIFVFFVVVVTALTWKKLATDCKISLISFILFMSCLHTVISGPRFVFTAVPLFLALPRIKSCLVKTSILFVFGLGLLYFPNIYVKYIWAF